MTLYLSQQRPVTTADFPFAGAKKINKGSVANTGVVRQDRKNR